MRFHPSVRKSLGKIRGSWPKAKLAAFGQTAFWDEPMKSVLVPMLDAHHPEAKMLVGPHDADYFGKCPGLRSSERFVICEHNDGPTRELWAAVGEISALFGAEKVPTRSMLAKLGVQVEKLLRADRGRYEALVDAYTTAWGWRGLVESGGRNTVARDIAMAEAEEAFRELLKWATDETTQLIDLPQPNVHVARAKDFLAAAALVIASGAFDTLADFFKAYWPMAYVEVLKCEPARIEATSTCELFRFNRLTCRRPRFRLVGHFLNPRTASVCRQAYSEAVAGSGMYELDRFGSGAIPFDLVVPGRGRGTITLSDEHLVIDTDPHIVVDLASPVRSVTQLAAAVEEALGPDVSLVGKAVALAYMMTSEFVFVLNEEGSVYVPRTREMARRLAGAGIGVDLCPVLRLRYHTWDSLANVEVPFRLPEHLAAAFGVETISARDFAKRWKTVVRGQRKLLRQLSLSQSPQDLMRLLSHEDHPEWIEKLDGYVAAHHELLEIQKAVDVKKHEADALRDTEKSLKAEIGKLQRLHGKMSRIVKPLRDRLEELEKAKAPAAEIAPVRMELACYGDGELPDLDQKLAGLTQELHDVQAKRKRVVADYRGLETGPPAKETRKRLAEVEAEAEAARLRMAANAFRVTESLPYTNHRPSAWWLPVVDPSGGWYRAVLESTELAVEEMV